MRKDFADTINDACASNFSFIFDTVSYVLGTGTQNRLLNTSLYGAFNGVRYVFPYLDYRLIDFAVSIPRHLYINWKWNRLIFREAFKSIMPPSMYKLRTKEDFSRRALSSSSSEEYDWYEETMNCLRYTTSHLNDKIWGDYINFNELDKIMNSERPADSEQDRYDNMLICLDNCMHVQATAEKAKLIKI